MPSVWVTNQSPLIRQRTKSNRGYQMKRRRLFWYQCEYWTLRTNDFLMSASLFAGKPSLWVTAALPSRHKRAVMEKREKNALCIERAILNYWENVFGIRLVCDVMGKSTGLAVAWPFETHDTLHYTNMRSKTGANTDRCQLEQRNKPDANVDERSLKSRK